MDNDDDDTPPRRTPPPRRRTEPRGIRLPTSDAAPDREFGELEERSGVVGEPLERIERRQRNASRQIELVNKRVGSLEVTQVGISQEVRALASMLRGLLQAADDERRTRADRAAAARLELEAAEARKEREDQRKAAERSANRKLIAGILVPSITALFAGIAAVVAAYNASGH